MRITHLALLLAAVLASCGRGGGEAGGLGSGGPGGGPGGGGPGGIGGLKYDATVTRTQLGIPHISAEDFGSIGYGYGYAFAEDNLCVLQEDLVTIRGERARYFGRDGSYTIVPNGVTASNVNSDFFWKLLATDAAWQKLKDSALPDLQAASQGFVDGYNRYIRALKAGGFPGRHLSCRNADWLFEITEADMYRRYYRLALIASSSVFINEIANAAPPAGAPAAPVPTAQQRQDALLADPGPFRGLLDRGSFGSNMYAIGKDGSANGMPLVWGNPHFPWSGTERLYISHLSMPSKGMDIMGSSLYGVPAILIGFNDHFAWSHTVSTAYRFTFYELTLDPTDPTKYLYDGVSTPMTATPVTVSIKEADGSLVTETRTLYSSKFGPMLVLQASGVPVLGWNNSKAYTLRDANAENDRLINQFAKWNQAQSLDEFIGLHKSILGIPWVNTVASGPNGKAYYGDVSVVPNVTDTQITTCAARPIHDVVQQLVPGLPVLDGSSADCEWGTDDDAPAPGIFGPANLPTLQRDDYVTNCNDSYWLTNPAEPITGFNRIIGDEEAERTLRTRLCILQAERRIAGSDGLAGTKFTQQQLKDVGLSSHIYSAELARDDVVASVCASGTAIGSGGPVDIEAACAVLETWDMSANLDARGAHIWREFWANLNAGIGLPVGLPAGQWLTPFDADDGANTPSDLNVASPLVQQAFADAVTAVQDSDHALDKPLGEIQHSGTHSNSVIPIFGGEHGEGAFTIVTTNSLDEDGYRVTYGNSYIQAVTWAADGSGFKPLADAFITYSQSTDPASPHYDDFTKEYSAKRWKRLPFRPAEIAADKISEIRLTE